MQDVEIELLMRTVNNVRKVLNKGSAGYRSAAGMVDVLIRALNWVAGDGFVFGFGELEKIVGWV
jgi:hypothetical protein